VNMIFEALLAGVLIVFVVAMLAAVTANARA
jgi:hypothetical protein